MLAPSLPFPPHWAAGIRRYEILRHLSERHAVSLLTYAGPDEAHNVAALGERGIAIYTIPPRVKNTKRKRLAQLGSIWSATSYQSQSVYSDAMQRALTSLVQSNGFDVVIIDGSSMSCFDPGSDAVVILDEHNIEYELLYRGFLTEVSLARKLFNYSEFVKVRREERAAWVRADACVVHSDRERDILVGEVPDKPTAVVTNGVFLDDFRPSDGPVDPNAIVFTGTMNYRPNADAVRYFVQQVLPYIRREKPEATFYAVGLGPSAELQRLAGPGVVVTGWVADVKPYLRSAAVYVAPVRFGSGTRIKVIEALAMGKAMVSTTLGCEGHVGLRPDTHFLVGDDPMTFAHQVIRLLDDTKLVSQLGHSGREFVEKGYSWPKLLDRLEEFLVDVACRRGRGEARKVGQSSPQAEAELSAS